MKGGNWARKVECLRCGAKVGEPCSGTRKLGISGSCPERRESYRRSRLFKGGSLAQTILRGKGEGEKSER